MPRLTGTKIFSIAVTALLAQAILPSTIAAQRSLESLLREHREAIEAASRSDEVDAYDKAIAQFVQALRGHLKSGAKGEEVHRTRFALVQALLQSASERKEAEKVLLEFDADSASCLSCAEAAILAGGLGLKDARAKWVRTALAKNSRFEDRMTLGVLLMSHLHEPKLGDKLFDDALAAAEGKEAKARVAWHRARATREREDLPEGAYEQALDALAKDYPGTRYGGIARDRLLAMTFEIGGDPLPIQLTTLGGDQLTLKQLRGKTVLLCFWRANDPRCAEAAGFLQKLHRENEAKGLFVLGVSLDPKKAEATDAIKRWNTTFSQAWVDGGFDADLALRYRIEDVPFCLLIGSNGKIAGMNFVLHDEYGRSQLVEQLNKALVTTKK